MFSWIFSAEIGQVKEGVRLRRLLRKKGIRGFIYKSFDRAQGLFGLIFLSQLLTHPFSTGWIAVTIIGIVTAVRIIVFISQHP